MAITDKLTTIKDYFLDWHERYYTALHKKTIEDLDAEKQVRETGDNNLQNEIDNIFPTSSNNIINQNKTNERVTDTLQRLDRPAKAGEIEWTYDGDSRGTVLWVDPPRQSGYMTWKDRARLQALGNWYEITGAGVKTGMTFWFNPILRLCQLSYNYNNCTLLKNDNHYQLSTDTSSKWYEFRPLSVASTYCTGGGKNPIFMYITSGGTFGLYSTTTHNKVHIRGNLIWFYRDQNFGDNKFQEN